MCDVVNNIQNTYSDIEDQVIHLRIDIDQLSSDIHLLKASIDDAMLPTVDNNVLKLVVAIFGAFTICIVICQLIIVCYAIHHNTIQHNALSCNINHII